MSENESGNAGLAERAHDTPSGAGTAWASVVLPLAIDVPARYAVPVEVRAAGGSLFGYVSADGRYYAAPSGEVTFIAHLPDGRVLQASTELRPRTSVRITLQGDTTPRERPPSGSTLLDQQRTALRFYVQSSLDSAKRSRRTSLSSALMQSADELRLELTKHAAGVQFLQLTAPAAFPMNVAYASGAGVKLVRLDRRLAADVVVLDERVELALEYLQRGRVQEAATTLRLQGVSLHDAQRLDDVTTAVVLLFVLLATSDEPAQLHEIERAALRIATRHPDVSDLRVIAAECAALQLRDADALAELAGLQQAGLPLLHRSFIRAARRLSEHATTGFDAAGPNGDTATLAAVHARLQELAPHVDAASQMLVITGRAPDAPGEVPLWRRIGAPLRRFATEQGIVVKSDSKGREATMAEPALDPAVPATGESAEARGESKATAAAPTKLALITAVVALAVWIGFAVYLIVMSDAKETEWTRIAWVFASVEAVAFAAAGLLFGTTINRQRAEQAEQKANANQKDAEGGRALAATLKAEEPAVVQEGGAEGGPRAMGGRGGGADDAAAQLAARHARLARQFFP